MEEEKSRIVYQVEDIKDFRGLINRASRKYTENVAYKYKIKNNEKTEYVSKTYAELKNDIEALATKLLEMGLKRKKSSCNRKQSL